jgi:hypothetical protein
MVLPIGATMNLPGDDQDTVFLAEALRRPR